jgi:hypothetical protein|tara:strand:- start:881 stop:1039 length:159 start_codon:yes stop_codon:yes gene_type:complete
MIETVVNMKDANGTLTGYLVNGVKTVPLDPTNRDYQKIQEWVAIDGNNITDP